MTHDVFLDPPVLTDLTIPEKHLWSELDQLALFIMSLMFHSISHSSGLSTYQHSNM